MPLSVACLMGLILIFTGKSTGAILTIYPRTNVDMELVGYNGLTEFSLTKVTVAPRESYTIDTSYNGLAVLVFSGGQAYPVILGDETFTLEIEDVSRAPSFTGSDTNEYFYTLLAGKEQGTVRGANEFTRIMVRAKQLLDSSYAIRTAAEIRIKKNEFHGFVRDHYDKLKHSDMVRRLIEQSFMMHEYVDYYMEGEPATNIRKRYEEAVFDGVKSWFEVLGPHIQQHEILNYIVGLYYDRSMVALASKIAQNFKETAYCPGVAKAPDAFPDDLSLTRESNDGGPIELHKLSGRRLMAFVSEDCPVSMVDTVMKARSASRDKAEAIIVVPVEKLNERHLTIRRMVSGGNILFVDDEKWRKETLPEKLMLPHFVQIAGKQAVEVAK